MQLSLGFFEVWYFSIVASYSLGTLHSLEYSHQQTIRVCLSTHLPTQFVDFSPINIVIYDYDFMASER